MADVVEPDDLDPAAHVLQGGDQADKVAVPGQQDDPIQVAGLEQGINGKVHVRIGLGGDIALFVPVAAHIFFYNLETALTQDVVIAVHLLPVVGIGPGSFPVFGQVAVGPQHGGIAGIGQVHQHIVTHAVAAAHLDVFRIHIDACFQHFLYCFLLFSVCSVFRGSVTPIQWWPAVWTKYHTQPG